jgi:hypothetical protein
VRFRDAAASGGAGERSIDPPEAVREKPTTPAGDRQPTDTEPRGDLEVLLLRRGPEYDAGSERAGVPVRVPAGPAKQLSPFFGAEEHRRSDAHDPVRAAPVLEYARRRLELMLHSKCSSIVCLHIRSPG